MVQLRNIDNSQVAFLPVDPVAGWSDTTFTSTPVSNFPPGPALVTVFTNGIPSDSKYLVVTSTQVVSRKMHNGVPFDINLPLTGNPGIECRSGGASNDYQVVLTFSSAVSFTSASVTAGAGSVSGSSGNGTTIVSVNLTGVTNAQRITVTLLGVSDGTTTGDVTVPMGVLIGDTNANGAVNAGDVAQTKSQSGQAVTAANFREDVNANGSINAGDVALVKSKSGTALPP